MYSETFPARAHLEREVSRSWDTLPRGLEMAKAPTIRIRAYRVPRGDKGSFTRPFRKSRLPPRDLLGKWRKKKKRSKKR